MNRSLKFRVWDKENKEMGIPFDLYQIGTVNQEEGYPPEFYILLQFTGLLDKESVEIYEGDILKFCYYYDRGQWGENKSFTKVIKWDDLYCGFRPMCGTGEYEMPRRYYEVIGNIYENPDLLGG